MDRKVDCYAAMTLGSDIPSREKTDASLGRALLRRFDIAGTLTILLLVGLSSFLLWSRYERETARLWEEARVETVDAASQQAAAMVRRGDILARNINKMELSLEGRDVAQGVGAIIPRLTEMGPKQSLPVGRYATVRQGSLTLEVLTTTDFDSAADRRELAAAVGLFADFAADRRTDPTLMQFVYASTSGKFMINGQADGGRIIPLLIEGGASREIPTIRPAVDQVRNHFWPSTEHPRVEQGQFNWVPLYRGDQLPVPLSRLSGQVIQGNVEKGILSVIYRADDLFPLFQNPPTLGRMFLVARDGTIAADSTRTTSEIGLPEKLPAHIMEGLQAGLKSPGNPVEIDSNRFVVSPLASAPNNFVLLAAPADAARRSVLREMFFLVVLLVLGLVLVGGLLLYIRRSFVLPAVRLMEGVSQEGSGPLAPQTHPAWLPWAEQIDDSRAETARHLRAVETQGRFTDAVVTTAIDCIITADEQGIITAFNPAAERVFGWSAKEAIGRKLDETIIPERFREAHRNGMQRLIDSGTGKVIGRRVELEGLKRDGTIFPLELALAEASIDGTRQFIAYLRDLSSKKETEAELLSSRESLHQSEKLAALGQLLAGVAHELNNPLAIVVGRASMLRDQLEGTPHQTSLDKLRAAADRCSRIVKTFLAMARQSGPRRSLVDINELVEGALDMTAYGLRTAGIATDQKLADKLPLTNADGDQIVQVLINLIINAQHAMEAKGKGGTLTLTTRIDPKERSLVIDVADTGPGVPKDISSRIFDPFFTTKDVGTGTGMGLSVSKGMIEAQGGTLQLVRNSSKGATFQVTVPFRAADSAPRAEAVETVSEQAKGRILIVDDEPEIAEMLAECLQPTGLDTVIVGDGKAALEALSGQAFDAVFTDVRMPGMDGLALYAAIKADFPVLATRVAFISGDVLQADPARAAAMDGQPLIEKPFNPDQIRAVAFDLIGAGDQQ